MQDYSSLLKAKLGKVMYMKLQKNKQSFSFPFCSIKNQVISYKLVQNIQKTFFFKTEHTQHGSIC